MAKPKTLPYEAAENEDPYSVTLHNTAGGSDKIYKLAIQKEGAGWMVNFENGRRGSTMAHGTKTKAPVSYAEARKACNAVLFEKVGGGYVPIAGSRFGDGMKAEAIATIARESSGYIPQLLRPIEEDDVERFLTDDNWVAEPKYNGERRFLVVKDNAASGGNRKGQTVELSAPILQAASTYGHDVVLDGEQIGDKFFCWDILSVDGADLRKKPWYDRSIELLSGEFGRGETIQVTKTALTTAAKRKLLADVKAAGGEGLVFKRRDAVYDPGKPGSDATWVKLKFWKDLSAIVGKVNDKRSVALELIDDGGKRIGVGNVTIPANRPVPKTGDVVEITYLYAYERGSLFQPTFVGKRNDIDVEECLASQRFFKPEEPEDDAAPGMRM